MKKHVNTSFGMGVRALAMVALCGATLTGCKDDFTLDDAKPEWLGESVLKSLQESGKFENYLKLMHDLDMDEILERTGSRTLFAAPDSAFDAFYAKNATLPETDPWHTATSYDRLSNSQKLLLAKCSMLNNAITMETLASRDGDMERGQYMRRKTLVSYTDTVLFLRGNQLPYTYNENDPDHDMWNSLREEGAYLTDGDGTSNMMIFFTPEHMAANNMVTEDLELLIGEKRKPTDVHVYDSKIDEQDITAQNGYINLMHRVISPLPNMAEVIRTNGKTNIFSHIMDRFSVPVYVKEVNTGYKNVHKDFEGKIYTKWYRTFDNMTGLATTQKAAKGGLEASYVKYKKNEKNDITGLDVPTGPEEADVRTLNIKDEMGDAVTLKFDPAWNAIEAAGNNVFSDMAAMFVPDDKTLLAAFRPGGQLSNLVETYTPEELQPLVMQASETNLEPLYQAIDHIPMSIIKDMINNVMKQSLVSSVKSKFPAVKNDAQDDLFVGGECAVADVKLACNGVVYITSAIYAPVDYVCVAAPAHISKDKKIMNWAIYNGLGDGTDYMKINYYAYLRAMTSRFTLFIPDDRALGFCYDTSSFKALPVGRRLLKFTINEKAAETNTTFPINCASCGFKPEDGSVDDRVKYEFDISKPKTQLEICGRLRDILESHTIVHGDESELMSATSKDDKDQYYLTKGGTAVKVTREYDNTVVGPNKWVVKKVQGGFQIENELKGFAADDENSIGIDGCKVTRAAYYTPGGNGDTYVLDATIIPAARSVYDVISDENQEDVFGAFFDLCTSEEMANMVDNMNLKKDSKGNALVGSEYNQAEIKYSIFRQVVPVKDKTGKVIASVYSPGENVSFFNNYNYTVYVPTPEAIAAATTNVGGRYLPTWDNILADYNQSIVKDVDENGEQVGDLHFDRNTDGSTSAKGIQDSLRIQAKITYLFSVLRLHFQDQSVFVDRSSYNDELSTACFYTPTGRDSDGNFLKTVVKRSNNHMTVQAQDINGKLTGSPIEVIGQCDLTYNVMARDVLCNNAVKNAKSMIGTYIVNSSAAVVHSINGILKIDDQYPDWNDPQDVSAVLRRLKITNKD